MALVSPSSWLMRSCMLLGLAFGSGGRGWMIRSPTTGVVWMGATGAEGGVAVTCGAEIGASGMLGAGGTVGGTAGATGAGGGEATEMGGAVGASGTLGAGGAAGGGGVGDGVVRGVTGGAGTAAKTSMLL